MLCDLTWASLSNLIGMPMVLVMAAVAFYELVWLIEVLRTRMKAHSGNLQIILIGLRGRLQI